MKITFVRRAGERDRVHVRRDDGTEVSWPFPTYGDRVPHDLVHLVVERAFGVTDGFWGRVARGADPKQPLGSDPALLLAEALANAHWSLEGFTDEDRAAQIRQAAGREVSVEEVKEVRLELEALAARWRELVPKGALDLTW